MAYKKTIWKNSIFEKPKTFRKQDNADGTFTLVPAFGQVLQDGTKVNADVMNNIENGIEGIEKKVDGIQSPIISVNNKIGIVELTAEDIKCKNGNSIESQMSDMATKKADKTEVQTAQNRADSAYNLANSKQDKLTISSSTTSTSTTQVANSYAVKQAMDKANNAYSKAEQAFTLGDSTRKDVVSILSSKGLEGLTTNSNWEQIKGIMQNMSLGKKWARGETTLTYPYTLTVSNLDFIPSIVLIKTGKPLVLSFENYCIVSPIVNLDVPFSHVDGQVKTTNGKLQIRNDGFICTESSFLAIKDEEINCYWMAIE